jgi:hypothetical protein
VAQAYMLISNSKEANNEGLKLAMIVGWCVELVSQIYEFICDIV